MDVGRRDPSPPQPGFPLKRDALKHLLILNRPPFGTECSYKALRLSIALPKHDPQGQINVLQMADAVP